MKKVGLVVCVLILVSSISFSLDISIGVNGALGYSTFLGSDYKDELDAFGLKRAVFVGAGVGAFVTLGLTGAFDIEPEAMFLRLGSADKESGVGKELFISHYLAPAFLLRLQLAQLYFLAGPLALIKVGSGKSVFKPESGSEVTFDFSDDFLTKFQIAATLGIGYEYPLGRGNILGELRGIYSFSKWLNQDINSENYALFAVMFMVGYSFSLQR